MKKNSKISKEIVRTLVLVGEDHDSQRRGNKKLVAKSECRFRCHDEKTLARCVEQIRLSDEHLRSRPEEQILWDWQSTYIEIPKEKKDYKGGDVVLGVAWYDEKFFKKNQKSFSNPLHLEKYKDIGLKKGAIIVTHWKFLGEGLV